MPSPPANRIGAPPAPAVTPEPGWLPPVVLALTALALFCMFTAAVGDQIRNGTFHAAPSR